MQPLELVPVPVLNMTNSHMRAAIGTGQVPVINITNSQMHAAIGTGTGTGT